MKKTKTLPQLVKEADKEFSRYVRLRDSEYVDGVWKSNCISCDRELVVIDSSGRWALGVHAGHFISRGHKALRWEETNVNIQCAHCNLWRDKLAMLEAYERNLDDKYGTGTAKRLRKEANEIHKPKREDLELIIHDSKEYVKWTLSHV